MSNIILSSFMMNLNIKLWLVHYATSRLNCYGSFLIKCLQELPIFAYIWGVSLRLPDLACPTEVGRPYLHLLADHWACRLCWGWWRRRWRLRMRSWRLHQWRKFCHWRIGCCYLRWKELLRRWWILLKNNYTKY